MRENRTMLKAALSWVLLLIWVLKPAISMGEELYPGRWWNVPEFSEKLQLTDDHRRNLDELYTENRAKLVELMKQVEVEQSKLRTLMEMPALDEAAISAQEKSLDLARAKLGAERMRYIVEVRKMLGPERFLDLKQYYRSFVEQMKVGAKNVEDR